MNLINLTLEHAMQLTSTQQYDGSHGENRELTQRCLIPAMNDRQAIACWLSEYQKSAATHRNYCKEAERLVLWARVERNKALSSLNAEDLLLYSQFLDDPQPRETWCGAKLARNGRRGTLQWRPFVGPLSQSAKIAAFKALTSLFNYLTETNYLAHNPIRPVRRQIKHAYSLDHEKRRITTRIIEQDEWLAMQNTLAAMPENHYDERWEKIRLQWLLALGYLAGLRNQELTSTGMNGFWKSYDNEANKYRWWLTVKGKGSKLRDIPVNQSLLASLMTYCHTKLIMSPSYQN